MSDEPGAELREQLRRERARALRGVVESRVARMEVQAQLIRVQGLRIEASERRSGSGNDDSGTPTSKESITATARRKAERGLLAPPGVCGGRGGGLAERSALRVGMPYGQQVSAGTGEGWCPRGCPSTAQEAAEAVCEGEIRNIDRPSGARLGRAGR